MPKGEKTLRNFDDTILANVMKLAGLAFFHRLSFWICMISIFGLWSSTVLSILFVNIVYKFVNIVFQTYIL